MSTGVQFLTYRKTVVATHWIRSFETSVSIYPSTGRNITQDLKVSFEVPVGRMAIVEQVVPEVTSDQVILCFAYFPVSLFYCTFLYHFFLLFFFCVYPPCISSPCCLVAWNPLGTTTQASPYATISADKGSEKNIHSIFFSFCFLLLPVYFRVVSCDFKTYFHSMRFY